MKTNSLFPCALSLALLGWVFAPERASTAPAPLDTQPKRLKRADSFLGVHFDFHAGPDCTEIGKNTTREMIENIIHLVGPDYLQIGCKGHRGLSSYPTQVGNQAPGFVGDPLRLWRQVTAEPPNETTSGSALAVLPLDRALSAEEFRRLSDAPPDVDRLANIATTRLCDQRRTRPEDPPTFRVAC